MNSSTGERTRASVSGELERPDFSVVSEDRAAVELYMFRVRKSGLLSRVWTHRTVVFLTRATLETCASADGNRVRTFIRRLARSRNRVVRWFGRTGLGGHRSYQKLEDKIDPLERMVKALNYPEVLRVWHAAGSNPEAQLREFLRTQVVKHTIWLIVDGGVTCVAVLLMPIPGPNILGWYPFFRALSHYRALKGARRVLRGLPTVFRDFPELADLENRACLETRGTIQETALKVEGLERFLQRVG